MLTTTLLLTLSVLQAPLTRSIKPEHFETSQYLTASMREKALSRPSLTYALWPSIKLSAKGMDDAKVLDAKKKANAFVAKVFRKPFVTKANSVAWMAFRLPGEEDQLGKRFTSGEFDIQIIDSSLTLGVVVRTSQSNPAAMATIREYIGETALQVFNLQPDEVDKRVLFEDNPKEFAIGRIQHPQYLYFDKPTWKDMITFLGNDKVVYFGIPKRSDGGLPGRFGNKAKG